MDFELFALWYITLIVSLVVHEAAHAWVAYLGGDKTAYIGGQVTLNPIPHMRREPFGTIVLPIVVLVMSNGNMCLGFAHAPIDARWANRFPKRAALMAAAGPLSNVLIAVVAFFVLKWLVWSDLAARVSRHLNFVAPHDETGWVMATSRMASLFLLLNILLAVLNLFPWPPFDGSGVVGGLSRAANRFYQSLRSQPAFMIVGLIAAWYVIGEIQRPIFTWVFHLI